MHFQTCTFVLLAIICGLAASAAPPYQQQQQQQLRPQQKQNPRKAHQPQHQHQQQNLQHNQQQQHYQQQQQHELQQNQYQQQPYHYQQYKVDEFQGASSYAAVTKHIEPPKYEGFKATTAAKNVVKTNENIQDHIEKPLIKTTKKYSTKHTDTDKQAAKQTTKHSDKQTTKQSDKQTTRHSDKQMTKQTTKPSDKQVTKHSDKPVTKHVDKQTTKHTDKQVTKHSDKQTTKHADKTSIKQSDKYSIKDVNENSDIQSEIPDTPLAITHSYEDHHNHEDHHHDYHARPKYKYDYGVKDPKSGDEKNHWEERDGDKVTGSYTIKDADGTTRIVEYTADHHNGFQAVVKTMHDEESKDEGADEGR